MKRPSVAIMSLGGGRKVAFTSRFLAASSSTPSAKIGNAQPAITTPSRSASVRIVIVRFARQKISEEAVTQHQKLGALARLDRVPRARQVSVDKLDDAGRLMRQDGDAISEKDRLVNIMRDQQRGESL